MKKIVIINDIHGNFSALNTILNSLNNQHIDLFIFTGDLIGIGANSNEVINLVKTIPNKIIVKGNHEDYLTTGLINPYACLENDHHNWQMTHISDENKLFIETIKNSEDLIIEGLSIHIEHYPKINGQTVNIIFENNYQAILDIFNNPKADVLIFGHNHYPQIIKKDKTIINIGACGCSNIHPGYTRYGLLTIDNKKLDIKTIEIKYDITDEIKKLDELNVPDKEFIKKTFFIK